ncbi:MAG: 2-oxoglutarate dehydrogenase complex dihydrolipoyllysine-residue succinyltransferase [Proteobacteria bacterium]|nr:2-oxoglutarate dehydrogenase complex dihydrolipoyllysine-residue succinyltransferase [Pseudomonadota bacterium]
MSSDVIVPQLGESVTEASVAKWHKNIGDQVVIDELLVELETDKITVEVSAVQSGTLKNIMKKEGEVVEIGAVLCQIDESNASSNSSSDTTNKVDAINTKDTQAQDTRGAHEEINENSSVDRAISPSGAKVIRENNLNPSQIKGTGRDGRITEYDAKSAVNAQIVSTTSSSNAESAQSNDKNYNLAAREEKIKMTRLRQTIAKRLKDSQNTAAILTTFNEIDMSFVINIRKKYQEKFQKKYGIKLGFMSFFVKAAIEALKEVRDLNAEIDGEHIIYKNYYDIGVAVGTEQGLVVPIIRDADFMSFADIETKIVELGKKAKEGKLSINEMSGGTFSITNGGIYGSMLSTPIINPPQSGILGMHNIVERPFVVCGEIKIRPIMYVALSYDHRIVDGKGAVTFLVRLKEMIENPERIVIGI